MLNVQEARLFGPAIFYAAKLRVLFLGADKKHPEQPPRIYTLTQSDVTSKLTLAISREVNKAQVVQYILYVLSLVWSTCDLQILLLVTSLLSPVD